MSSFSELLVVTAPLLDLLKYVTIKYTMYEITTSNTMITNTERMFPTILNIGDSIAIRIMAAIIPDKPDVSFLFFIT